MSVKIGIAIPFIVNCHLQSCLFAHKVLYVATPSECAQSWPCFTYILRRKQVKHMSCFVFPGVIELPTLGGSNNATCPVILKDVPFFFVSLFG